MDLRTEPVSSHGPEPLDTGGAITHHMLELSTTWKVFAPFSDRPQHAFSLRELARTTGLAHTSLEPHLDALLRQQLITKNAERQGTRTFTKYTASHTAAFTQHKRLLNLRTLHASGLIDHLRDHALPRCIILFGSYERGEDTQDSDIDLFIEATAKDLDLHAYERALGRRIQLHWRHDFTALPKELKNNILNGTTLTGFLEAIR